MSSRKTVERSEGTANGDHQLLHEFKTTVKSGETIHVTSAISSLSSFTVTTSVDIMPPEGSEGSVEEAGIADSDGHAVTNRLRGLASLPRKASPPTAQTPHRRLFGDDFFFRSPYSSPYRPSMLQRVAGPASATRKTASAPQDTASSSARRRKAPEEDSRPSKKRPVRADYPTAHNSLLGGSSRVLRGSRMPFSLHSSPGLEGEIKPKISPDLDHRKGGKGKEKEGDRSLSPKSKRKEEPEHTEKKMLVHVSVIFDPQP
ncbi:hypothetical protein P7C73_g5176, partial [Tremellales sp. Uapishka_1]